jgi:hypothetical protein
MTVSIQGNNYESALKKFMNLVAKRMNAGMQKSITLCILEKELKGGEKFVPLEHASNKKKELIAKIEELKPHNGTTPLEEFSEEQLEKHLAKLQEKLERKVSKSIQKRLKFQKKGV